MSRLGAARPSEKSEAPTTCSGRSETRPWSAWTLNLYAEAGEAGGCYAPPRRPLASGGRPDPERSELEAVRRARGKVRRYCATHRLNRFVTLTYAGEGCHDPLEVRRDVGEFFKGLRRELGLKPFPYVWAPEWHPEGTACTFTSRSAAMSSSG